MTLRTSLLRSALALCVGLPLIPAAQAVEKMSGAMMHHDGMKKHKKDGMMSGDHMRKGDAMKKDDAMTKKDDAEQK